MSTTEDNQYASRAMTSPGQMKNPAALAAQTQEKLEQERQRLAIAVARVLGRDKSNRSTDQQMVYDFLTKEIYQAVDLRTPNPSEHLMVFEGRRRKAADIVNLLDLASGLK